MDEENNKTGAEMIADTKDPLAPVGMGVQDEFERSVMENTEDTSGTSAALGNESPSTNTVTSDDVRDEPEMEVTEPGPSTAATGLEAEIESTLEEQTETLEEEAQESGEDFEQSQEELINFITDTPGEAELQAQADKEAGVNRQRRELNEIDQKIRAEQNSLRRQRERIRNEAGLTKGQQQARIDEIERKSLSKQADLAIIRMGTQQKFDSAKAIADQKVNVQLERQERELSARTLTYQTNKEIFTKEEQRAFEAKQTQLQSQIESRRQSLKQVNDVGLSALKNGAPKELVQQALNSDDPGQAMSLVGDYIGMYDRMKAESALRAQKLKNRQILLELAAEGDQQAIDQLGFDPSAGENLPSVQDMLQLDREQSRVQQQIDAVNDMLGNESGLKNSAGIFRSEKIGGFFQPVQNAGVKGAIPVVGSILGAAEATQKKNSFLSAAKFIVENETFDRLINLKQQGATFGALSENELRAIKQSATRLNSLTVEDNGEIVGFRGSEEEVRSELEFLREEMKRVKSEMAVEAAFGGQNSEDYMEAMQIISSNRQ